mmetsp:Transcript_33056/g.87384  ORF Transcript_33056/g.87384 Transcript_33056/m.87384 type:complete len:537 (-) Transcript_33056:182-1792(-)
MPDFQRVRVQEAVVVGAAGAESSSGEDPDEEIALVGGRPSPRARNGKLSGADENNQNSFLFRGIVALGVAVVLAAVVLMATRAASSGKRGGAKRSPVPVMSASLAAGASSKAQEARRPSLPPQLLEAIKEATLPQELPPLDEGAGWLPNVTKRRTKLGLTFLPEKVKALCLSGGHGPPTKDYETVKLMIESSCGCVPEADSPPRRNIAFFRSHKEGAGNVARTLLVLAFRHHLKVVSGTNLDQAKYYQSGNTTGDGKLFWHAGCETEHMLWPSYKGAFNIEARPVMERPASAAKRYPCDNGQGLFFDQAVQSYSALIEEPFVVAGFHNPADLPRSALSYNKMSNNRYTYEPASYDFGLYDALQVEGFIEKWLFSGRVFPILLDRLDESLALLRRVLNLDLLDVMYSVEGMRQEEARRNTQEASLFAGRIDFTAGVLKQDALLYAGARTMFDRFFTSYMSDADGQQEMLVYKSLMRHVTKEFCAWLMPDGKSHAEDTKADEICYLLVQQRTDTNLMDIALGKSAWSTHKWRRKAEQP